MISGSPPPDPPLDASVEGEAFEAVAEDLVEEPAAEPETSTALVPVNQERLPVSVDPLARYIQEVRRVEELDPAQEQDLARRYRERGDAEAARRLITANLRLVVKLALMYRRAFRNVWDLIQEGNIGLMEALKRYDPEQKVRFSTYAAWWIKAYMLKYLLDNHRLVRVGTTNARRKLLYNLRKEQRKLAAEGIQATPKLLAERFGVTEEDVVEVDKALSSRDVSVDAPLGEDAGRTFGDVLPAEQVSVEEQVSVAELREKVDRALEAFKKTVTQRDRALIELRLAADEPLTLQELGDRFGVTREAMRQAENKLKKKLAVYLREQLGEDVSL
ncbi:MAG: sigma-70 family RNA polymerase sigma factor [Acidobacteriota bacterium]|nr:sigma-70 family RNA polymerase sigma factor [Acidobacteriota bacterium]